MSFITPELIISGVSLAITLYFWLVKASNERPNLEFFQLSNFRATLRSVPGQADSKRLCISQMDTGGVLVVNQSTRQDSVVVFDCFLKSNDANIRGDWGFTGEDKPPWNVGPQSTIAISPACFFEVPAQFKIPDDMTFKMVFYTASGTQFSHTFTKEAPRFQADEDDSRKSA
ncbi:MAG: hypothetical protein P8M30_17115 [Planctomycetaceae bacterium]|jgi:hypothetical protein|nr:hypothetical protein [Planctomycetaceae bacterium]